MDPFGWLTRLALGALLFGGAVVFEFMREGAETYNVSAYKARELLKSADLPDYVLGSEPKRFDLDTHDPTKIVWIVMDSGSEVIRFTASLAAVNAASTKIRVEVSGPTTGPFGDVQSRLRNYHFIRHLYVMAMKERVAAAMEGRTKFELTTVMPATALATVSAIFGMAVSNALQPASTQEAARTERDGSKR